MPPPARPVLPRTATWVLACTLAETVGMTAAAVASRVARDVTRDSPPAAGLAVVVAGGLVEGLALGLAQPTALRGALDRGRRRQWLVGTVVVAGLGWAAASAPSALMPQDSSSAGPPLVVVLPGAAALGVAMGAALGWVQARALRGRVPHPRRWVSTSALAWAPTMAVVFAGASTPSADWSTGQVAVTGALTGAAAGAVLGLVGGLLMPSLLGPSTPDRVVLALLGSRLRPVLGGSVVGLRLVGTVSGRTIELPVQRADLGGSLVVVPGHAERKRWWRNLRGHPDLSVLRDGVWLPARAHVLVPGDDGYPAARDAYTARWRRARLPADQPVVRLDPLSPQASGEPVAGPAG